MQKYEDMVKADDVERLKSSLQQGLAVNALNASAESLVHISAARGSAACLRLLLDWAADVNAANQSKYTPLHFAVREGHLHCVKILVDARANVDAQNVFDWTPLHFAAVKDPISVQVLLNAHAYIDSRSFLGVTPLGARHEFSACVPAWWPLVVAKRQRVRAAFLALYGSLRKKVRLCHNQRIPKDIVQLICAMVWETRFETEWSAK